MVKFTIMYIDDDSRKHLTIIFPSDLGFYKDRFDFVEILETVVV